MTVKVLSDQQKTAIATICGHFNISKEMLGVAVGVSRRTVERVVEEAEKAKAKTVSVNSALVALEALMYKHKITVPELETLLEKTPHSILKLMSTERATRKSPKGHVDKQIEMNLAISAKHIIHDPVEQQAVLQLSPTLVALKQRLTK